MLCPSIVTPAELGGTRHLSAAQFVHDQPGAVALVASQERSSRGSPGGFLAPPSLNSFFNQAGLSVVAGRAALVRAGDDPVTAGVKLSPMAIGMLVSSPLAGIWADRRGSRTLAALGMLVGAAGLALMTTLEPHSPYWQSTLWLFIVGVGSGMFNSPNTAAMMGTVAPHRRGIAAGTRTMLQNTGAVISIAFVLAVVTAAVPKDILFKIFSGLAKGLSDAKLAPFIQNMHTALWVLAATSVVGAIVSLMRPSHASTREAA